MKRKEYKAPQLTELGGFQKVTGYLGIKGTESRYRPYPSKFW